MTQTQLNKNSSQKATQEAIDICYRGRAREYFSMGLGSVLFADGLADAGADILERIASVITTRDFNEFSLLEVVGGATIGYIAIRARNWKDRTLRAIASDLNESYHQNLNVP
jgi:hypothetical protein